MLEIKRSKQGLYIKFLVRMYDHWKNIPNNSRKNYLPFVKFRGIICRTFSMEKHEAFEYVKMFEELDYVSFVRQKGIKLNYRVI